MTNLDLLHFFLGLSSGFRISLDLESSVVVLLLLLSAIVEETGGALLTSSQSWYTLNIWSRPWKFRHYFADEIPAIIISQAIFELHVCVFATYACFSTTTKADQLRLR